MTAPNNKVQPTVYIIGAGLAGTMIAHEIKRKGVFGRVAAFLDDDPQKIGSKIEGIPVLGPIQDVARLIRVEARDELLIAIPSIKAERLREIYAIVKEAGFTIIKLLPGISQIVDGNAHLVQAREINPQDLLGRTPIKISLKNSLAYLRGKRVLITGAGGSIGSELARQLLSGGAERLYLFGHGENSIYLVYHELIRKFQGIDYVPVIADIQDYDRLLQVFEQYKPAIVYHAAAHKHVPMMERNPKEAFKNNIRGTYNVAKAVDEAKVPKMVMISTDKAVNPPNVMGATKRVAELIVTGFNQRSQSTYCAVRFGNVLGSRGSVIPVFERQIAEGGPVTVTDFRMTRYFMTIPEASRLVIHAGAYAKDGEVFILDMGKPVKIYDLAKKMVLLSGHTESEIPIVEVGIRPGEKLYEELLVSTELVDNQVMDKIFVGKVNVMPLEAIDQKIEEFRSLSGDELKEAIISFANETTHAE